MNVKLLAKYWLKTCLQWSSPCGQSAVDVHLANSNHFQGDGGFEYATSEAGFEAKACDERRTGVGRGRLDFFTGGGRVGSGCTGKRYTADAELFTES